MMYQVGHNYLMTVQLHVRIGTHNILRHGCYCLPAIFEEKFGGLSDAPRPCVRNGMHRSESMRQIFFIFCMKLPYHGATKTDICLFISV